MFALNLARYDDAEDSKIHFGGYDQDIVATRSSTWDQETRGLYPDGIFWNEINSDSHWQMPLYKIKVELSVMET